MKKVLVMVGTGVGLFISSVVGLLAAQGRLNHEGTKGIPILESFFPEEKKPEGEKGKEGKHGEDGAQAEEGDKAAPGRVKTAGFIDHDSGTGHDDPQGDRKRLPYKQGKSVLKDAPKGGGHGDAGHGDGGHGESASHGDKSGHGKQDQHKHDKKLQKPVDPSWDRKRRALENRHPYRLGLFDFSMLDPDMSAEQVNEIIRRVNKKARELTQELAAVGKMRADLQAQLRDVKARQEEVARQMQLVAQEREKLNQRILEFERKVLLIHQDEIDELKRNAKNIEAFEPEAGAELILSWWKSGKDGQDKALKILRFMSKDAVDGILSVMNTEQVREILDRRLTLARTKGSKK